jgi:hypothetical protein
MRRNQISRPSTVGNTMSTLRQGSEVSKFTMAEAAFFRIGRINFHLGQAVVINEPTVLREQFRASKLARSRTLPKEILKKQTVFDLVAPAML